MARLDVVEDKLDDGNQSNHQNLASSVSDTELMKVEWDFGC